MLHAERRKMRVGHEPLVMNGSARNRSRSAA